MSKVFTHFHSVSLSHSVMCSREKIPSNYLLPTSDSIFYFLICNLLNLNGKIVNEKNAVISINNRSFRYGDGCFETIKMVKGKIIHAEAHFSRLWAAMQVLQLDLPKTMTPQFFTKQIQELASANGHASLARIRLTIFRGDGGLFDIVANKPQFSIQTWALNDANNEFNSNGLIIDFYADAKLYAGTFSGYKFNNFLPYVMAAHWAKAQHLNDAILLNQDGLIADTCIANLFIVKNGTVYTQQDDAGMILGTMRKHLLASSKQAILPIEMTVNDVLTADECFLTNSTYGIRWVKSCGNKTYTNLLSRQLHDQLIAPLWL
jgi:branched-subunit amino acid aminotransferase/4-amino-4-deoxychorismate lyase